VVANVGTPGCLCLFSVAFGLARLHSELAVKTGVLMRYAFIFGLGCLIAAVLSLMPNSSHGLGTGANSYDFKAFGWPVEVWSRTTHTYRTVEILSPSERKVEEVHYPTKYAIKWAQAGALLAGAVSISFVVALCILPKKDR
jgi:hypothetical protein